MFVSVRLLQPDFAIDILMERWKPESICKMLLCMISLSKDFVCIVGKRVQVLQRLQISLVRGGFSLTQVLGQEQVQESLDESSHCIRKVEPFFVGGHLALVLMITGKAHPDVVV